MVVHIYHPSYTGSVNMRITVQTSLGINMTPYLKKNQRAGEVVQVVEYLLSKCEVLSSTPVLPHPPKN
jgi:hypothetical protein